jgi:hypothetical protein
MRFVHSLVKVEHDGKRGWLAPVELGEAAPHYVSFAIPFDNRPDDKYTCEAVRIRKDERVIEPLPMIREGNDSFFLAVDDVEVWYVVRSGTKEDRQLPYLGKLKHPDFDLLFGEIEPEDPSVLDRLLLENGVSILGCDPFRHYSGAKKLMLK